MASDEELGRLSPLAALVPFVGFLFFERSPGLTCSSLAISRLLTFEIADLASSSFLKIRFEE